MGADRSFAWERPEKHACTIAEVEVGMDELHADLNPPAGLDTDIRKLVDLYLCRVQTFVQPQAQPAVMFLFTSRKGGCILQSEYDDYSFQRHRRGVEFSEQLLDAPTHRLG